MISYQLEGTREIIEALDALNYKELVKIIRNVERKSLSRNTIPQIKPVVGSYHQNVNPRVGIEFAGGTMFKAGVIIDKRESGDRVPDAVLVRWFDKGTVVRQTKKGYNRDKLLVNIEYRMQFYPVLQVLSISSMKILELRLIRS